MSLFTLLEKKKRDIQKRNIMFSKCLPNKLDIQGVLYFKEQDVCIPGQYHQRLPIVGASTDLINVSIKHS